MLDVIKYETYLQDVLNQKQDIALLCENKTDKPIIATNEQSNYINEEKYIVLDAKHQGGTLVLFPKDITFTWISNESKINDIVREIYQYLLSKGLPLSVDNNDIMLKDKKLFGVMSYKLDDIYYEGLFISFNTDVNIIKQVCIKQMNKVPTKMPEEINRDTLIKLLKDLCKKYNLELYGGDQ